MLETIHNWAKRGDLEKIIEFQKKQTANGVAASRALSETDHVMQATPLHFGKPAAFIQSEHGTPICARIFTLLVALISRHHPPVSNSYVQLLKTDTRSSSSFCSTTASPWRCGTGLAADRSTTPPEMAGLPSSASSSAMAHPLRRKTPEGTLRCIGEPHACIGVGHRENFSILIEI